MKHIYLFFLLFFYSTYSSAFLNIEHLRQSKDMGLLGSVGLKLNGASGNTNKFNSSIGLNHIYRNEKNEYLILLNYFYSEVSKTKNTNKGQAHIRYTRKLIDKHSGEFFSQIEFDEFKSLSYRSLFGLGWRYQVISSKVHHLASGLGAFYETEEFEDQSQNNLPRINAYLSYKAHLATNATLTFVNYLQPAFEDLGNFRFRSHLNLKFKIHKNLSISNEIKYAYDSNLENPIRKGDLVYLTGFNLKY